MLACSGPVVVGGSRDLGWRGTTVLEVDDPHEWELSTPARQDLAVVVIAAGVYVIESARERGWASAVLAPGRSAVTAPGRQVTARWRAEASETFRSVHVHVAASILDEVQREFGGSRPADYLSREDAFVRETVAKLHRASSRRAPALHADALGTSLAAHLHAEADAHREDRIVPLSTRDLRTVVQFMQEQLGSSPSLLDLAALVHVSGFHFLRRFRESTGETPMRFLTSLRMGRARLLLREGDRPVSHIAHVCGYTSPAAFGAAFRRHHGTSPERYRQER